MKRVHAVLNGTKGTTMSETIYKVLNNTRSRELWRVAKVILYDDGHETELEYGVYYSDSFQEAQATADELNAKET